MADPTHLKVESSTLSVERSAATSAVDAANPWPGLASFTEDARGFFFGREKETEELSRLVRRQTLTVLFGQSGLGKSSLLQAGLFPILREGDHLPLYLRLDHAADAPPLADQVRTALNDAFAIAKAEAPAFSAGESLWEYFHRKDVDIWSAKNRLLTPVLAFDQFEEIFTLGRTDDVCSERSRTFLAELTSLVENRAPAAVRARLDAGSLDPARFNYDKPSCQVILSLREDFLPDLEGLKQEMPALIHNRLRLKRLSGTQALEIVTRPAPHLLAEGVAERIVEFVSGGRGGSAERLAELDVEPPLLSVICRELNDRRRALGQAQITAEQVSGNRREILTDFYERSVADLPETMRTFVEDHLLTKSGFRDNFALETALEFPGVTRPLLDTLVARRLVRIEDRLGVQRVELTHDVLAEVIRAARDARLQRLELAAAARQTRRQRWLIAALAAAVVGLLIGAFFGIRAQRRAEQLARDEAARASRTDFVFGSQLLDQGKVPEGLAYLVRAGRTDRTNSIVGPRLISALAYRAFALPTGRSFQHPAAANVVGFSAEGKRVITAAEDEALRVWDIASGELVAGPMKHDALIVVTAITPDGSRIAALCNNGTIGLWETATCRPLASSLRHDTASLAMTFSPNGRWLATGAANGTIKLWDAQTGELKTTLDMGANTGVSSVNFSPDSTRLVTTTFGKHQWRIWAVPTGEPLTPLSTDAVSQANHGKFSPDGKLVVICDSNGAQLWDWAAGKKVGDRMVHSAPSYFAEFSADGTFLAVPPLDQTVRLWSVPSGKVKLKIDLPSAPVVLAPVRITRDGRRLMVAGADGAVRVYDTTTGSLAMEPIRAGERVNALLSPDDREIWTGNGSGLVRHWRADGAAATPIVINASGNVLRFRWSNESTGIVITTRERLEWRDPATGREVAPAVQFPVPVANAFGGGDELKANPKFLGVRTRDNDIELWDLRQPAAIARRRLDRTPNSSTFIFSQDQKLVAIRASNNDERAGFRLQETESGRELSRPPFSDTERVGRMLISPDNRLLATQRGAGLVEMWDIATAQAVGKPMTHRIGVTGLVFSPDGTRVVTGDVTGKVRLWETTTGQRLLPPMQFRDLIGQLTFSRDGKWLLTGGGLETAAYILDTQTGALRTEPLRSAKALTGASYNADETRVVTSSQDGTVRVWGARSGQLLVEPLRRETLDGNPEFSRDGRFVISNNTATASGGICTWAIPAASTNTQVPDWMLRLATAVIGSEVTAGGGLRETPPPPDVFAQLKSEVEALPDDAPYVKWGRWFLADPATRNISPEHPISATEADKLSGTLLAKLIARDNQLHEENKLVEAEMLERQMLDLVRSANDKEAPIVGTNCIKLAQTLIQLGKFAEAELLAREALAVRSKTAAVGSFEIASATGTIGSALAGQKRYAEAEPLLIAALDDMKKIEAGAGLNAGQKTGMSARVESLVQLYEATGRPEKAAEWKK